MKRESPTNNNSLHLMDYLHRCSLFDQSLNRLLLSADFPHLYVPKGGILYPRLHYQRIGRSIFRFSLPVQADECILEPRRKRHLYQHSGWRLRHLSISARTGCRPLDNSTGVSTKHSDEVVPKDCRWNHVFNRYVWRDYDSYAPAVFVDLQDLDRSHLGLCVSYQVESARIGCWLCLRVTTNNPSPVGHDDPNQDQDHAELEQHLKVKQQIKS
jgi:hypothetical protein